MGRYARPGKVYLRGVLIVKASDVNFDGESGDQEINTNVEGFAGFSDGASKVSLSFENAIPETGFEQDWLNLVLNHVDVDVSVRIGTVQYELSGRFTRSNLKTTVNSPAGVNVSFTGRKVGQIAVPVGT